MINEKNFKTLNAIANVFEKILNVENLVELNEKTRLWSVLNF